MTESMNVYDRDSINYPDYKLLVVNKFWSAYDKIFIQGTTNVNTTLPNNTVIITISSHVIWQVCIGDILAYDPQTLKVLYRVKGG